MSVRIERLTGSALAAAVPELARLRMMVFRDWPYLYDGTLDYEQEYLATFSSATGAVLVAAYDAGAMVGAATAAPLLESAEEFAAPFRAHGDDPAQIFYFGESVLLKAHRGKSPGICSSTIARHMRAASAVSRSLRFAPCSGRPIIRCGRRITFR
jgi:hypothetical protein